MNDPLGMHAYQQQLVNEAHEQMQRDHFLGHGMFAPNVPIYMETQPSMPAEAEEPPLLDDQEEAFHYLLRTLSASQRDALLVLSMRSPANALDQILGVLWDEFDDERDRGSRR
ncbi:hypothetical protein GCM10018782_50450 [Streptomyces griseoaurantiacus]|nr:hypothetical protein GCM10018782_50450 [Streptomyces griseoaurantiacus]